MRFEVLGMLRVFGTGREIPVTRPAQRRLLLHLLDAAGTTLSGPQLIDRMWGITPPTNAKDTLHVHLVGLRKVLGQSVIETRPNGYRVSLEGDSFDLDDFASSFTTCVDSAAEGQWTGALFAAEQALALWRGEPFAEIADNEHVRASVQRIREQKAQLDEMRVQALLALGRNEEALTLLEGLVSIHPLREQVWAHLMLARYRVGRPAEALAAYQQVRRTLGERLGLEPMRQLRELEERILLHDPTLGIESGEPKPNNLPSPTTTFVGRQEDIDQIQAALQEQRTVTISGPPGIGKTRLAVEVGRRMLDHHPAGTWFVAIPPDTSLRQVAGIASRAFGLTEAPKSIDELIGAVGQWRGLLIVDAAEHSPEAAHALSAALSDESAKLRAIVTTRQSTPSEGASYRLTRLPKVPGVSRAEDAIAHPAVQLFVDRARGVDRSFAVTDVNVPEIVWICNRLGGVPLAIELAASWAGSLDVKTMSDVVGTPKSSKALTPALEMTHRLLQTDTKAVFAAMSVFPGSFDLEALSSVVSADSHRLSVASAVARLVGSSLVETVRTTDGGLRYQLLEPVRDFATEQLTGIARSEAFQLHADYFVHLAGRLAESIGTTGEREAFDALDQALPDLRRAWATLLANSEHNRLLRSVADLDRYFFVRFLPDEGIDLLTAGLAGAEDPTAVAAGLGARGFLNYIVDDFEASRSDLTQAAEQGDKLIRAQSLTQLARVSTWTGQFELAERAASDARRLFDSEREERGAAAAELWHAINELNRTRGRNTSSLENATQRMADLGDLRLVSMSHRMLSDAATAAGDEAVARRHAAIALEASEECDDTFARIGALVQTAIIESKWGDSSEAARKLLEADSLLLGSSQLDRLDVVGWPALPVLLEAQREAVAARVLSVVDQIHAEYERSVSPSSEPILAEARAELGDSAPTRLSVDEMASEVRRELHRMAKA